VAELATAWLLPHTWLSTVIAGARRPEQLDENLVPSLFMYSLRNLS